MVKFILIFLSGLISFGAHADFSENARCVFSYVDNGSTLNISLGLDMNSSTNLIDELELELLADNGFYMRNPVTVTDSKFVKNNQLNFTYTEDTARSVVTTTYNSTNYTGNIEVFNSGETASFPITCYVFKAF